MNCMNKALLLLGLLFLIPNFFTIEVFAQHSFHPGYEGIWEFEKAEYYEKESIQGKYVLKQTMVDIEELNLLNEKLHYLPRMITIEDETADVICLQGFYFGKYRILDLSRANEAFSLIIIGNPEEVGLEYNGRVFNAQGIEYRLRHLGDNKLSVTREGIYYENSREVYGAVMCVMKKMN